MKYAVTKTLTGGYAVKFLCSGCGVKLTSPLKDAGAVDACPDCGKTFKVPGEKELAILKAKQAAKQSQIEAEKLRIEEAKRQAEHGRLAELNKAAESKRLEEKKLAEQRAAYEKRHAESQERERLESLAIIDPTAESKACPYCSESIARDAKKCKHCGEFIDPGLRLQAAEAARPIAMPQWNPGIAALLSFLLPGAGQIYKGQIGNGIAWFLCTIIAYACLVVPGIVLHLCCVAGAATGDPMKLHRSVGK